MNRASYGRAERTLQRTILKSYETNLYKIFSGIKRFPNHLVSLDIFNLVGLTLVSRGPVGSAARLAAEGKQDLIGRLHSPRVYFASTLKTGAGNMAD